MNNREFGALMGACIGDVAGKPLEFLGRPAEPSEVDRAIQTAKAFRLPNVGFTHPPSECEGCRDELIQQSYQTELVAKELTDDGQMTLLLAYALWLNGWRYDPEFVAQGYYRWANQEDLYDIGNATANALRFPSRQINPETGHYATIVERARRLNQQSQANGSLMRSIPLAIMWARNYPTDDYVQAITDDVRLTHPNPICLASTHIYTHAVRDLLLGKGCAFLKHYLSREGAAEYVEEWMFQAIIEEYKPQTTPNDGHVKIALQLAFYYLGLRTPFWEAIEDVISLGGDTDTNACVVGGMLGARDGWKAIHNGQ